MSWGTSRCAAAGVFPLLNGALSASGLVAPPQLPGNDPVGRDPVPDACSALRCPSPLTLPWWAQTVGNILRQAYGRKEAVTDELVQKILGPGLQVRSGLRFAVVDVCDAACVSVPRATCPSGRDGGCVCRAQSTPPLI